MNRLFSSIWQKKVWRINRSGNGLLIVITNFDGFSLANHGQFAKFAKLFPCQTFLLYGILKAVVRLVHVKSIPLKWPHSLLNLYYTAVESGY